MIVLGDWVRPRHGKVCKLCHPLPKPWADRTLFVLEAFPRGSAETESLLLSGHDTPGGGGLMFPVSVVNKHWEKVGAP